MEITPLFRNSRFHFYRFPLKQRLEPARTDAFRIGKATLFDFLLGTLRGPRLSISLPLRRGDHYFTARKRCKIVAVARICYADTPEVELHAGEASLISFHTLPEYRGRGLYVALIKAMLCYLAANGFTTAYIWADRSNSASIRGIEKVGFTPLSTSESRD